MIPTRLDTGDVILFFRVKKSSYYNYDVLASMKLWFMVLEAFLYETPPTGLILIVDLEGVNNVFVFLINVQCKNFGFAAISVAFDESAFGSYKKFPFLSAGGSANKITTNTSVECCLFY